MNIDPRITSIAILPFVLTLVGSWVLSRRERTFVILALVAQVCYSLILAVLKVVQEPSNLVYEASKLRAIV